MTDFPWSGNVISKLFQAGMNGWRGITFGAMGSFLLVSGLMVGVGEEAGITRFIVGIAVVSGILAGIGEGYFRLLRTEECRSSLASAGLSLVWLVLIPCVFVGAFQNLKNDAPKSPGSAPAAMTHTTVITKTGPFTSVDHYDSRSGGGDNFGPAAICIYAAILSLAWLALGLVPLVHAAGSCFSKRAKPS